MSSAVVPEQLVPSREQLLDALGPSRRWWIQLEDFARETYGLEGAWLYEARTWSLRIRRSGRSLFTLLPGTGSFRTLVVVGPTAWELAAAAALSPTTRAKWETARPYADGRWLWLDVSDDAVVADIETLVKLKSPPPRKVRQPATPVG